MLGIRASPKIESGTSAGEAALGHMLAVPGQLLTTIAPPADTPAPPVVIPAIKRTYAEAAPTPALDGATQLQRGGVGLPLEDNYTGLYLALEKGTKVFKLQLGTRQEVVSLTWGGHHWRWRSRHTGGALPGEESRRSSLGRGRGPGQ